MPRAIRHVSLGATIEGGLAVTVFLFACGSSSLADAVRIGHSSRWVALFATCGLALAAAAGAIRRTGMPWHAVRVVWLLVSFLAIALLSASWSPAPRTTVERAGSFGVLLTAAVALGLASRVDLDLRRRVLTGLAMGASFVGVAGVLMLVAGMPEARQPTGDLTPERFRGFGQNPNTVPLLAAIALPIIAWLALSSASVRARAAWWVSFLVLYGTTVASQSRGGLIGAFIGSSLVVALLIRSRWHRVAAVGVLGALVLFSVVLREVETPATPAFVSAVQPGIPTTAQPGTPGGSAGVTSPKIVATPLPSRDQEIGDPSLSTHGVTLAGSGRVAAWLGALKLIEDRPLLGYGFGTEERVFVDRWYYFQGARPENSLLGILLQVGAIGLLTLLAFVVVLVRNGVRALRAADPAVRSFAVAPVGALAAALLLVFFQSYVYSVGDVATVTVWVVLALLGLGVGEKEQRRDAA